jgi:hypothetical protein
MKFHVLTLGILGSLLLLIAMGDVYVLHADDSNDVSAKGLPCGKTKHTKKGLAEAKKRREQGCIPDEQTVEDSEPKAKFQNEKNIQKTEDKYYFLVEKTDTKWELKSFGLTKPEWSNKNQEILAINRFNGTSIFPDYDQTPDWKYLGSYSARLFSDSPPVVSQITYSCKMRGDNIVYTPCNSSLTSFVNTDFFGMLGNSRFSLSEKKLNSIISETGLLKKTQECRTRYKDTAQKYSDNNITVKPTIVDNSGYYDGTQLYSVSKIISNSDCLSSGLDSIKYRVLIDKTSDRYVYSIDESVYNLTHLAEGQIIRPTITISDKRFSGFNVNDAFTDGIISVNLRKILGQGSNIEATAHLGNNTNKFIQINSIALHIDDTVVSISSDKLYELPPQTVKKDYPLTFSARDTSSEFKNGFHYNLNKMAGNDIHKIGVSVKYLLNGELKSMYLSKRYTLNKLANAF